MIRPRQHPLRKAARAIRDAWAGPPPPLAETFTAIHDRNGWADPESRSGMGSTRGRAAAFLEALIATCRDLDVRTIVDAPCGDFNWAGPLADAVGHYVGIDIVPELIARNQDRYGTPRRQFLVGDLARDPLPPADLVLCRDCLVHLSLADATAVLATLAASPSRFIVLTTFLGEDVNGDIRSGGWRPLNMQRAPFHLPAPLRTIDEHCAHSAGRYRDKRLGVWSTRALATAVRDSRCRPLRPRVPNTLGDASRHTDTS